MDIETFWDLVQQTRRKSQNDIEQQANLLITELTQLSREDILNYSEIFSDLMYRAYVTDLWGAAYIIRCGCSDSCFTYFRAWLIAQGRIIYEDALANPEILSFHVGIADSVEAEAILLAHYKAYEIKTGDARIPYRTVAKEELTGNLQDFHAGNYDELIKLKYPLLHAKFGNCEERFTF